MNPSNSIVAQDVMSAASPWQQRTVTAIVLGLLFTGLAQMPIFKRYYLADVPGFAWTADFYASHRIHYILAAFLLGWLGYRMVLAAAALRQGWRPGAAMVLKALVWAAIVITGLARVAKNTPDFFFSPTTTMLIDWAHLGCMLLLAPAALAARRRSRPA